MANQCVSCDKGFRSQETLNQHLRSQDHACRQLANQLDRDRKFISQSSGSNRKDLSTQSQPSRQKTLESQTYPLGSRHRCNPCNRFFKDQTALDQHLQKSSVHKTAIFPPLQVQTTAESWNFGISGPHQRNLLLLDPIPSSSHTSQTLNYRRNEKSTDKSCSWSVIPETENRELFEKLSQNCHSPEDLLRNKYLLHPYSASDISGLRKCKKCGRLAKDSQNDRCYFHPGKRTATVRNSRQHYTCCQTANRGCTSAPVHEYRKSPHANKYQTFASSPPASSQKPTFQAITLDCEMAEVKGLRSEVILICAVDYFTGAVLLNSLVSPGETIRDWRTEIHGITSSAMDWAISQERALAGWKEAREELWKLIDQNTILVGHALQHDLDVLRMVHTRVVDSAILARNAVGTYNRQWGLQKLCKELLGFEIRSNKGGVHDCLEDVLATREVVLLCTQHEQELEAWANVKSLELTLEEERRKAAKRKLASKRAEQETLNDRLNSGSGSSYDQYESDEREILHWSDIAEDFGWPHPDTGYYPWSD
ncbi:related to RNA EXonuclease [Phialocephala subalpina]|uniref:Related to RNA EXonuclease n=1 Tax=Phialocephala subalpina TaxID=576137 RepID=A0A1L7X6G7_9HELO|nr:related to RNA EXonuclease [Phialocephala subalpina]